MTTSTHIKHIFGSILAIFIFAQASTAQNFTVNPSASDLKIEGTSNIHDWEMKAEEFQGNLQASFEEGQLIQLRELNFAVVAESLKSGKSGMDKNAYKALKTNKNKRITFELSEVKNIDCTSKTDCVITAKGLLSIAGTKKPVELVLNAKVNGDNIILSGEQNLKMTTFNVDPPTAMFGTVTTGDELKISYQVQYSK